jgi:magnesium chelatase subunit D
MKEADKVVREDRVFSGSGTFEVKNRRKAIRFNGPAARGRRIRRVNVSGSGRYIKARLPGGRVNGPMALDATLRAAAPHQNSRKMLGLCSANSISVLPHDIREKVLSRLTGASLLFAVDASGSMGSKEVMGEAKSIVLSLLTDAYQKRDRVALIAFRGTEARQVLPFTTSVELAQKRLCAVPTGGKSPLALALAKSLKTLKQEILKNPMLQLSFCQ